MSSHVSASQETLSPHKDRRPLLLIGCALLLCAWGLMWGLPYSFDPAQDSVVPIGQLAERGFGFERITAYRYPPFHFLVLRAAFLPARGLLCLLPGAAENPKVSATAFILTARLVSLLMALGTVWFLYRIGRRLWEEWAGLAAGLFLCASPVTLYYARNANLDAPMLFWLAAALLMYVRVLQEDRPRDYAWLGILCALAVCTKDQAYGFILLMPAPICVALWRGRGVACYAPTDKRNTCGVKTKQTVPAWEKLLLGFLGFVVPFVLIHNILFDPEGFRRHVETILGPGSEPWREFAGGPMGQLRLLTESLLRLMDAWTLPGLLLAGFGLALALRPRESRLERAALLVPAISYYLSFLAPIGYVYPRFMLPAMLALAPFAGYGAVCLWRRYGRLGPALTVAALAWVGLAGLSLDYVMAESPRYEAQRWLEETVPQGPSSRIHYIGELRDMPRFNAPLDAIQIEAVPEALAKISPPSSLLVLSLEAGQPALGPGSWRLASILRRHLGEWGLSPERRRVDPFYGQLLSGRFGYVEVKRFRSPVARAVPEVAESVNRTIIIMQRAVP